MQPVSPEIDFPEMERGVLAEWEAKRTFQASLAARKGSPEYTFYDGPPFANGLPHYGHLLANTIKDTVPRYWTMRGRYVERRFGWDCHGVPVEYEIEKRDGIKGRADILKMGVKQFNDACRESVLHYATEWQKTISRLGRWVDWDHQYRTMDRDFMESVWWVVSELHRRGLIYRDFKVVPYSPRITAVLSNFEANQNYKDVQDPALTVKFKLADEDAYLLAWTTTPWTLVSNLGLCVGPEISYVKVRDPESGETYYLAEARLDAVFKKGKKDVQPEILAKISAGDLTGRRYQPLFPYFSTHRNAFQVLQDAYVSTEDGTGIVHLAPAYGEDDFRICRAKGIDLVDPVDEEGRFTAAVPEHAGVYVKDADRDITRRLKEMGHLLRSETVFHSYPFCDRTDTPLIYKAIRTWYVAVERLKERLVANNQTINWVPDHLRDGRMGKWLESARDWAISRNRFWGTPIPIWICDRDDQHLRVIGSVAELEKASGVAVNDLHIHHVDQLTFACDRCSGRMTRVPEVLDCWFESGSMPYAQSHYPFENSERFKNRFPADFIAEGLDQTRGWFYTLSVLSAALFDQPAFRNVVVNGLVLAADGKKMSKRLKNYTPPLDLVERFGADSIRLYMLNSAVLKAGDLCFTDQGVRDTTRAVLLPLWNAFSFLTTYASADGWQPSPELAAGTPPLVSAELDRWLISRFQTLCSRVHAEMERYRLFAVVPAVLHFIEDMTNWYIRLSRRRFWGTDGADDDTDDQPQAARTGSGSALSQDARDAYSTLFYVLCGFSKIFAPFAPFISDRMYKGLTAGMAGMPESVHLCDAPLAKEGLMDASLEGRMEILRRAAALGRSLRAKHKLRTRQVLPSLLVITRSPADAESVAAGADVLKRELNVKEVGFSSDEERYVKLSLKPNLKTLGKKLGARMNEMRTHLESLNQSPREVFALLARLESAGGAEILGLTLTAEDFLIDRGPLDERLIATESGMTVLLDTRLTPELLNEGLAREVVNRIQRLRKEADLVVTDRISVQVAGAPEVVTAVSQFKDYVARETLAVELVVRSADQDIAATPGWHQAEADVDGRRIGIRLKKVN